MTGIASLLAGLGGVAIAFGLLSALIWLLQPYSDLTWIVGNLVVGIVLLGAAVFMSLDSLGERLRSGEARRAGKYGTSAVVGALLGIAILSGLAFLSTRYTHRFDVSEAGVHTLSEQTLELLEGLAEPLTITAFFMESEGPAIRDLLDRYVYASDRVELRFVDPNSAPGLVEELGLATEDLSRGVVRLELESGEATALTEFSEPAVTNAILKLVKSTGKKVYFLSGHNERVIEALADEESPWATGPDSFGRAADALANETYQVEKLLLATQGGVPEDASAVVIAGPTRPYLPNEIAALQAYVEGGGSLFVAIDPRANTNLYELLATWGIVFGDDVIVDRQLALFGQATTPIAGEYDGTHAITSKFREPTLFPMARSVELDAAAVDDYSILVRTGTDSWAERDLDAWRETGRAEYGAEDLLGPVPLAIAGTPRVASEASEGSSGAGRIVVFGDSDFATNEFIDSLRNRDLFVNSVNWLAGDVEQISVRPNRSRASSFQMSQEEFRTIQTLSLFLLPQAIAVFGVVTWWLRRRR
ncbi:MAG: GldG family protein [Deltaproteobacteria bacterium]|jgi:ABC-type uncharacterized transport system involved in gliding motility auxiliary subunit|nr:GldG family protein [Deltaproteobacteria bacterium]